MRQQLFWVSLAPAYTKVVKSEKIFSQDIAPSKCGRTISCIFYVNRQDVVSKVGKMCLILSKNVYIMVGTSGFLPCFMRKDCVRSRMEGGRQDPLGREESEGRPPRFFQLLFSASKELQAGIDKRVRND